MNNTDQLGIPFGNAICYSGYREGQSPVDGIFPSYEQIVEDLKILEPHWQYLRIYDCSKHAELVLDAVRKEKLPFKVMLGADVEAEISNPNCPWGAEYQDAVLEQNKLANQQQIDRMIDLAKAYEDVVFSVSVGNEATVDWGDRIVPVERLVGFVKQIKQTVKQPVTFCENYVPWTQKLAPLVEVLDFISVHTYPVWEQKSIDEAIGYTEENVQGVAQQYPDKPIVVTEAGWTTTSNGRGIEPDNASQALQAAYCEQLMQWSKEKEILTFVFEAFDEPWKGSDDPNEPEKHWGLFTVDRQPKLVMQNR